jgi:5S rRNA maturation endonuclease (ribonuclease M5)
LTDFDPYGEELAKILSENKDKLTQIAKRFWRKKRWSMMTLKR